MKKLDEITETVRSGEMPLSSFTVIHHNAKLSSADKLEIEKWVSEFKKQIK
ncbi:heme-binding domain-containing protein [Chryseobacterium artocarpi]|uniref:heme-binding domain-containing protein n=1 Tax=Chryseobacterium artocarpi TaxID=1414727 RepID=UPI003F3222F7